MLDASAFAEASVFVHTMMDKTADKRCWMLDSGKLPFTSLTAFAQWLPPVKLSVQKSAFYNSDFAAKICDIEKAYIFCAYFKVIIRQYNEC